MDKKSQHHASVIYHDPSAPRFHTRAKRCLTAALLLAGTWILLIQRYTSIWNQNNPLRSQRTTLQQFQQCSITNLLETGLPFLDGVEEIGMREFVERRRLLAEALFADGIDAFIIEPGYTFQYYANISQKDWEPWEPEERPFLMIVQPELVQVGDKDVEGWGRVEVEARTSFLTPSFEVERAKRLGMASGDGEDELKFVPWEEHWNPYGTLREAWKWFDGYGEDGDEEFGMGGKERKPKIMVDEEMRDYIQRGLSENGFEVVGLGGEVEKARQVKSEKEISIVRAVNTGTVEAVRAMRGCMRPGLTETEVMQALDETLRAAGLEPFFDIVLFDENASNPHGGTNGSKVLEAETFVLIDVGAHLFGYSSDICRTFFPPFFPKPISETEIQALPSLVQEKIKVWDTVLEAQTQSMKALHQGNPAASVDIAARIVITDAGYGEAFTHRVGHGIGIKAHESPYLNKGNVNTTLKAGMTFTSEPGVYLVGKFGVRHEDILLVRESGEPEVLTGRRAMGPWDP